MITARQATGMDGTLKAKENASLLVSLNKVANIKYLINYVKDGHKKAQE